MNKETKKYDFFDSTQVYVINLKKDIIKKQKIANILESFKLNHLFIDAIDANKKNHLNLDGYNVTKRKLFLGRELIDKEIAITNSHIKALNTFLKSKLKYGLILEDDIEIPLIFVSVLRKITSINYEWDVIRFINKPKFLKLKGRKVFILDSQHSLIRLPKLPGGGYAYIVSRRGAKKIIKMTWNYYHPIDILLGQTWKTNLNSLFCTPGIINHPPVPDHIENNDPRYIKEKKVLLSKYFFSRFFYKIYESFMKWGFYYYKFPNDWVTLKKIKKFF